MADENITFFSLEQDQIVKAELGFGLYFIQYSNLKVENKSFFAWKVLLISQITTRSNTRLQDCNKVRYLKTNSGFFGGLFFRRIVKIKPFLWTLYLFFLSKKEVIWNLRLGRCAHFSDLAIDWQTNSYF